MDINKFKNYIHYSTSLDKILEWIHSKFQLAHARQWMELAIEIPLATTLADARISPEQVMEFLEVGYTIDKALPLLFKGIPLDKAPSPKRKRGNMSYSEKIKKGIHPGLTDRGTVLFKEFLQEHISQGNSFKSIPRSQVNHAMRVHVENCYKSNSFKAPGGN
ncbi:hypothetical protein DSO57_1017285 [Entomophthora muscae]|uniref:Uncharacterized protein n=1 Tax=Entomophthora muscae TaxID=34485 RepID=A0ACC2UQG5_9FUNG|nr:hypothetical protein DSO57_1017285 [Entomophthora muscae]